jgi:phosphate transport system permease protein
MADISTTGVNVLLADRGRLRRRRWVGRLIELLATSATVLAVGVLALVIGSVLVRGVSALSLDFLTQTPSGFGEGGGGIADAIVGTALLVALATVIAVPVGLLVAIYTTEFAPQRVANPVRFVLDVLNGVPTIVTGIFIYGLIVVAQGHQSGYAGSIALAIVMLPIVARTAQEVLELVPGTLREAAYALGIARWRTVLRVIVPTAAGGLLTGALLAVARVAGETAPLLFVSSIPPAGISTDFSQALPSIPLTIFKYSESPNPENHTQAWAAAFLLIMFVLLLSIVARAFYARSRKRIEG